MGFIQKLFGGTKETAAEKTLPWIGLIEGNQLLSLEADSVTKTQLIFKHSTRCGISRMVMNQFVDAFEVDANIDLYYLDVLDYRELSRTVASKFQVLHESPQVLVIKNGAVVAHASHGAINDLDFSRFI
ncbi:bacillithiol system protein YtxJ [Flavobacteriaceae bacterium MAR_2010_72]|nr:bacillithiol system protein YtxJ [Flavobacteriaceae bacterium MAR_2010_72]TVZ59455.1 bacillithiol system protein YtxJ [Flavobacteriaceae bacterium MAR_2010_105]